MALTRFQKADRLPPGDATRLAALIFAVAHGAVDLKLAGHAGGSAWLGDPAGLVRLLLALLREH